MELMKKMQIINGVNIREVVGKVNAYNETHEDNPITKEDIVSIVPQNTQVILIYFK